MAYDGYMLFNNVEVINLSRTAQLAVDMGIDVLWTDPDSVAWIQEALGGVDYDVISEAPWYDAGHPASAEFAGIVPLSISGLDDSTRESVTIEYVTDGGSSGKGRNKTLPVVGSVAVLASTPRGAKYGKSWLDKVLGSKSSTGFCTGAELRYFPYPPVGAEDPPAQVHRRNVSLTRAAVVTRKTNTDCSSVWMITFTWTANDPFEYGDEMAQFTGLGGAVTGSGVASSGSEALVETSCPVYDYSPLYDPLTPALVPPPSAPDFYPTDWALVEGATLDRSWVRINPIEPTALDVVPVLTLTADAPARYVRVSIFASDAEVFDLCDALWSAIVSYLPADMQFIIDGEPQVSYVWDGLSAGVRRSDSLVFGAGARPIQWTKFNDPGGLLVTLDVISGGSDDYDGGGTVRAALSLVPKSD